MIKVYDIHETQQKQINEAVGSINEIQSRFNAQQMAWESELKSLAKVGHERSETNLKLKSQL